jgi:plastocyanin domain-containing protein
LGILGIVVVIGAIFALKSLFDPNTAYEPTPVPSVAVPQVVDGQQVVKMSVSSYEYTPSQITVQQGVPVKWVVDASQSSGCTSFLVAKDFGISQRLDKGENVFTFTPEQKGTYRFSCSMNMVQGTITVV